MEQSNSVFTKEQLASLSVLQSDKSHHKPDGSFHNPWPSYNDYGLFEKISMFAKFQKVTVPDNLPAPLEPDWNLLSQNIENNIRLTWIGHAAFLIQMDGFNVLTDPIFSCRCSPFQWVGPSRIVPIPPNLLEPNSLPPIHLVVISHNHYDHLDKTSVEFLTSVERMKAVSISPYWAVPLGIKKWLLSCGVEEDKIIELDWWGRGTLPIDSNLLEVCCLPCQHFSGRSLLDRNETLWASWAICTPKHRVFFGGDTGYRSVPKHIGLTFGPDAEMKEIEELQQLQVPTCPAFRKTGELFGPFDLALIPIGAYSPRPLMSPIHINPLDAVIIHQELMSKKSVGMHWSTFVLTDEPILNPSERLKRELDRALLSQDCFVVMRHGETINVE